MMEREPDERAQRLIAETDRLMDVGQVVQIGDMWDVIESERANDSISIAKRLDTGTSRPLETNLCQGRDER